MKVIGLLVLLGLSPMTAFASCNIDFEVQGELDSTLQYQLTYYNTLHSRKTMDLNNLTAFTKNNIELPGCPQKHKANNMATQDCWLNIKHSTTLYLPFLNGI
ncbi:hypothetical protein [Shewanella frigidimarina]|uniref:hypothetical protein n=1 Tax=Shewanella frigidimarina TaxID=56812 RepID=UPI003D7B6A81